MAVVRHLTKRGGQAAAAQVLFMERAATADPRRLSLERAIKERVVAALADLVGSHRRG